MIFDQIPWKVKKNRIQFEKFSPCMTGKEYQNNYPYCETNKFKFVKNLQYDVGLPYSFLENIWSPTSHLWRISSI